MAPPRPTLEYGPYLKVRSVAEYFTSQLSSEILLAVRFVKMANPPTPIEVPNNPRLLWTPSPENGRNLKRFIRKANHRYGCSLETYKDLHDWSISPESAERFWLLLFEFLAIKSCEGPGQVFTEKVSCRKSRVKHYKVK